MDPNIQYSGELDTSVQFGCDMDADMRHVNG